MIDTRVQGAVESGFEAVRDAFAENFERHGEVGAACCVYRDGRMVVDLWGGIKQPGGTDSYDADTLQLLFSAGKGITAIVAHMLAQEGRLDFDAPVVRYWPEFGAAGKENIPVRWLFSHKAGLPVLERPIVLDDIVRWTPAVDALAAEKPVWDPGSAHGYHTYTYGWLAGEVIGRVIGGSVGRFVAERIAGPLAADFWMGLPESEMRRLAPVVPGSPPAPGSELDPLTKRLLDRESITFRSFAQLAPADFNGRPLLSSEQPALGIGTARGLARIYAACIGEVDGVRLIDADTLAGATATQAHGDDLILLYETHYGTGFQLPFPFRPMAGEGSFGHYGSGGSVGFANPRLGIAFGYAMNRLGPVWGADPRSKSLVDALLACL